jgi:hypothetical protein
LILTGMPPDGIRIFMSDNHAFGKSCCLHIRMLLVRKWGALIIDQFSSAAKVANNQGKSGKPAGSDMSFRRRRAAAWICEKN